MSLAFKKKIVVEGWGVATQLTLLSVSEDGYQTEFTGEYLKEEDADKLAEFWQASKANRTLIFLAANLTAPTEDDSY